MNGYKQRDLFGDESDVEPGIRDEPVAASVAEQEPLAEALGTMDKYEYESRFDSMIARAVAHRRERELMQIPDRTLRRWKMVVEEAVKKNRWLSPALSGSFVSRKTRGPVMNIVHLHVDELFIDECASHPTKDLILEAIHEVTEEWVELRLYPTTDPGDAEACDE